MAHLGDFALETTIYAKFCTVTTTGAPTQLAGSPVVSVYENDDNTQITAGVTLNVDEDSVTGLNQLVIAATAANGYEAGKFYDAVITTGTVGGTSVVGYCVASFTIQAISSLRPTTAARTLDVTATGAAGIDWANVENPTTAVNLSATNIDVDQVVASVSGAVASVTTVNGLAANVITAASMNADASAEIADAVWDEAAAGHVAAGSFGEQCGTDIDAILVDTAEIGAAGAGLTNINLPDQTMDITGNITGNLSGSVGSVTGAVGSVTGAVGSVTGAVGSVTGNVGGNVVGSVGSVTGAVGSIGAGGLSASSLAADAVDEIWDELIGDSTITARQALKVFIASLGGILSGAATTTVTIRNVANDTDVIVATVDADGNRSAVTLTV